MAPNSKAFKVHLNRFKLADPTTVRPALLFQMSYDADVASSLRPLCVFNAFIWLALHHDIHVGAHGLTVEKVCMRVWPVGIGPHVRLFSNPFKCAHDFAWRMALVAMPCSLAWRCPAGHSVPFVLPRSLCDELLQGCDARRWCSRHCLLSPASCLIHTFCRFLIMRADLLLWRARQL